MQQTDFADSFIKGMLGWIRWIASSIANLFQTGSGRSGDMSTITWFADNWIKILIGLIVVGVLVDWLVWMARWRPYWVWFRRRRILLDNDVEGIDDDDLMLHYGDMAPARARRGAADDSLDLDDLDEDRPEYDLGDLDEDDDYEAPRPRARRYEEDEEDAEDEDRPDEPDFDELYDDRNGDYAGRDRDDEAEDDEPAEEPAEEPDDPDADAPIRGRRAPREGVRRRGLFKRPRKSADAEEDPFSVEGDFFDDLGEDPMDDIVSPRVKLTADRNAQDTSVYQRPRLLPGDEPGAVRGADEEDGWHSGYTQRSAERGRRRKRDAGA
jgi:hypothetical protein